MWFSWMAKRLVVRKLSKQSFCFGKSIKIAACEFRAVFWKLVYSILLVILYYLRFKWLNICLMIEMARFMIDISWWINVVVHEATYYFINGFVLFYKYGRHVVVMSYMENTWNIHEISEFFSIALYIENLQSSIVNFCFLLPSKFSHIVLISLC